MSRSPEEGRQTGEVIGVPPVEIDIRRYMRQQTATFRVGDLERVGRVDRVGKQEWILSNDPECLNSIEFIKRVAKMLADRLRPFGVECLLAPTTRAMMTAFATAVLLGHEQIAIARKTISPAPPKILKVPMTSITSGRRGVLMIDGETEELIRGKRLALLDDVISRGDTMLALARLAAMAGAEVTVISAVGIEGAAPFRVFEREFREGRLVYLSVLPLFASGQTYDELMAEKQQVEAMFRGEPIAKNA